MNRSQIGLVFHDWSRRVGRLPGAVGVRGGPTALAVQHGTPAASGSNEPLMPWRRWHGLPFASAARVAETLVGNEAAIKPGLTGVRMLVEWAAVVEAAAAL